MPKRHKAFTLAEMLVVMGIIILFIAMAVPAVRALTGSNSISMARNQLASVVNRAREEAVALQDIRGVLFFIDPATDRVICVICQAASIQDYGASYPANVILLDAVPGRDSLMLPTGIRLQTMFNGVNPANSTSATPTDDRFMGYNLLTTNSAGVNVKIGGCILFDANGRLIVRQYGFQMAQINGAIIANSTLCTMLFQNTNTICSSIGASTTPANTYSYYFIQGTSGVPYSQLGLVIFDQEPFKSLGYNDADADMALGSSQTYTSPWTTGVVSEQTEEQWIDQNSTPVLINRFNGTLIKGE